MRRPRRPRTLSGDEARLWAEIAKLITPLRARARPRAEPAAKAEPAKSSPAKSSPANSPAKSSPGASPGAGGTSPARMPARPAPAVPSRTLADEFAQALAAAAPAKRPGKPGPAKVPKVALAPAPAGPVFANPAPAKAALAKPAPAKAALAKPALAKSAPAKPVVPMPTAAPYRAPPQVPRPPAGLERQARLALRRGTLAVEARIDLHGMIQSEAHAALTGFPMRARAAGHAHVLVVTGKGGSGGGDFAGPFSERGVLRRSVPHWLRGPELRGLVLGFEEAARHHGGGGALYVRLRRR